MLMKSSSHKGADTAGPTGVMPVTSDSLGRRAAGSTGPHTQVPSDARALPGGCAGSRMGSTRSPRDCQGVQVHVHHGPLRSRQMQESIHVQSCDWHMHGPDARARWTPEWPKR
ncbi:hypothetical protein GCM10009759_10560 [Kitasatospora saccharophila]|uniref:Uncharacterized protein n=1 Tax=Kitasatospora saccharophila TaxID=407973 RepID=A0ABP5I259_9ACTN